MILKILPAALDDMRKGADFYAQQAGNNLSMAFVSEFERVIDIIEKNPMAGGNFQGFGRRYLLRRFPYSVIYQYQEDLVNVLAVTHHRQRPGYWKQRSN